jgi:glycosyltransferase involved in cell wall biosynthesis
MRRLPLGRLLAGGAAGPGRVFHHNVWYRGHTNRRYEELVPRLERVDAYLLFVPEQRLARAAGYRLLVRRPAVRAPLVAAASRRYRAMLATELDQIAWFRGAVVADVDDPEFSPREAALLARPNVRAVTVTAERAAERLRALGVDKPFHVVPQGAARVPQRPEPNEQPVVGYIAAHLLVEGDRGAANALYNVEHLLELWDEIRARVPHARLHLVGLPSDALRARVAGRDDVELLGRRAPADALAAVAHFDVALYPRTADEGIRAVKIAEYLAAGVPVVSYDYEVVEDVRDAGAGILASSPREFVAAVERLLADDSERARLAAAARAAGRERDWDVVAARYAEILDRYLSRS